MRGDVSEKLHDRQAEQALLGAMMLDSEIIPKITEIIGTSPNAFFTTDHQLIYAAIISSHDRNNSTDSLLVATELQNSNDINRAGGPVYLYDLQEQVVEIENAEFYAQIVREKSIRRELLSSSQKIRELAADQESDLGELINEAQELIFQLNASQQKRGFVPISSIVRETLDEVAEIERTDGISGIPTGFIDFDLMTSGLHSGEFIIIAARPGMGKTTFVLNVAQNIAIDGDIPVAIFSLEMPRTQLAMRMLASEAGVDFHRLRTGSLNDEHWELLAEASDRFFSAPIFISDDRSLKMQGIRSEARRLKSQHPDLEVLIIDYLQLVAGSSRYSGREQEVGDISRSLKRLAGELDVVVIACSQLSREVEKRPNKRPQLSDLRESGSIEQDADLVAFLYRDDYYDEESEDQGLAELMIRKQRNGPTGNIEIEFHKEQMRFANKRI